jgi:hypothetical protein
MLRSQELPCGRSWQTSSPDGYVGGGVVRRVLRGDRWLTPLGPETTTWVGCRLQRREPGLPDTVSSLSRCARLAGPAVSSGSALDDGPVGGPFECGQHVGEGHRPGQVDQGRAGLAVTRSTPGTSRSREVTSRTHRRQVIPPTTSSMSFMYLPQIARNCGAAVPRPGDPPGVTEEQPRLPLSYYEASVPVPPGWDARPCAYLLFGPPYDELASEARGRGWIVEQLPGKHLHQLVDPDGVARSLLAIADQMGVTKA